MVQDPRYANRELDIMKVTNHPNIVSLLAWYHSSDSSSAVNLHLLLECLPTTLDRQAASYNRSRSRMPNLENKVRLS